MSQKQEEKFFEKFSKDNYSKLIKEDFINYVDNIVAKYLQMVDSMTREPLITHMSIDLIKAKQIFEEWDLKINQKIEKHLISMLQK